MVLSKIKMNQPKCSNCENCHDTQLGVSIIQCHNCKKQFCMLKGNCWYNHTTNYPNTVCMSKSELSESMYMISIHNRECNVNRIPRTV